MRKDFHESYFVGNISDGNLDPTYSYIRGWRGNDSLGSLKPAQSYMGKRAIGWTPVRDYIAAKAEQSAMDKAKSYALPVAAVLVVAAIGYYLYTRA